MKRWWHNGERCGLLAWLDIFDVAGWVLTLVTVLGDGRSVPFNMEWGRMEKGRKAASAKTKSWMKELPPPFLLLSAITSLFPLLLCECVCLSVMLWTGLSKRAFSLSLLCLHSEVLFSTIDLFPLFWKKAQRHFVTCTFQNSTKIRSIVNTHLLTLFWEWHAV